MPGKLEVGWNVREGLHCSGVGGGEGAADKAMASCVGVGRETLAPEIFDFCQVSLGESTAGWNGMTDEIDVLQERGGVHFEA